MKIIFHYFYLRLFRLVEDIVICIKKYFFFIIIFI
jgi:hypothetical protein